MKKCAIFVFFLLLAAGISNGCHLFYLYIHEEFAPSDFCHSSILKENFQEVFVDEALKKQALEITNQPFFYCGCGQQMTAFESADHLYVIKFFNPRDYLNREEWFKGGRRLRRLSSLKWLSRAYLKRKERLLRLFNRYQIGFEELKEESGLVYVHLNKETGLQRTLHFVDKKGRSCQISLKDAPFVLQKKCRIVFSHFDALAEKGDIKGIQEGIVQLKTLFLARAEKGFTDRIQTLHNNYGFVEGKAMQIDLGRIEKNPAVQRLPLQELERITAEMKRMLASRYPHLKELL